MVSGQRTTGRYQLIVGPWEHLNGSSVDVDPLELEWFDTWLKHERTGMARAPTPLPGQLPQLAGGVYTIARSATAPSPLTVETLK
jgi:hypothetical protein